MRRMWVLLAAMVVVGVAVPASALTTARSVNAPYQGIGGVQGVISGSTQIQGQRLGFVEVVTGHAERSVRARLFDDSGQPVAFELAQGNVEDASSIHEIGEYCSATAGLVRLPQPGVPLIVYINAGPCAAGMSVPTRGVVSLTFR